MSDAATTLRIGAAYIRVSSDDQLEYFPDSQLKVIRDYARREGYIIPDDLVFQDDGISGKSADRRPAFRLMIATAKEDAHAFDSIFVWKYSRFARNQEEAIMYKNLLKKNGVMVEYILHNPAYIGKIRWSEEGRLQHRHPVSEIDVDSVVYVDGKHEALIDMGYMEYCSGEIAGTSH